MNQTEVQEAIARACPEWQVDSIRFLDEGDFCWAYLVNEAWIFRVGKHEAARQSLVRESCLLPRLANHLTLSIPSPHIAGPDPRTGLLFLAHPLLPGAALSQSRYLALAAASRSRCAEQVASFLTQLHSTDLALAHACDIPEQEMTRPNSQLLPRARAELYSTLAEPERQFLERVIGRYLELAGSQAVRPVLLHGDLSPAHVLFGEASRSITAIIDFGDMMIGDPAWDLVFIYEDYGLDFLARLLPVYQQDDRAALVRRIYQLYLVAAIDWAVGARARGTAVFAEATAQLRTMRLQEEEKLEELLSACGVDS